MNWIKVSSEAQLSWLTPDISPCAALDTEYTELNVRKARMLSISLTVDGKTAYVIPPEFIHCLNPLKQFKYLLFQNHKVDHYMLNKSGLDLRSTPFFDSMLLDHLIDETRPHSLEEMVLREFGDNYKQDFWGTYESFEAAPEDVQMEYQAKDVVYTYLICIKHLERLSHKSDLVSHVHKLSMALFDTECQGILVDVPLINRTYNEMSETIQRYLPRLREEFDLYCSVWEIEKWQEAIDARKSERGKANVKRPQFNFSSDAQLKWLLYEALKLPVIERTKKKQPSTSYDTLLDLSESHPALKTLVEYKGAKTVFSTFVEGMRERIENGRIYPSFNINGTHTGRISHKDPNMGNIPRDGIIRNFFIPEAGKFIIGADYSQLEVIVEANLTKDDSLIKVVMDGASKHDITANGLGISRDLAKTVNFGLQYGAGIHKLSKIMDVSYKEAEFAFNQYWHLYRGVKKLRDATDKKVEKGMSIINIFGRERHFPKEFDSEFDLARAQRQAYNHLIQGPGADITNMAYYRMWEFLKQSGKGRTWFSVHDEIVAECSPDFVDEAKQSLVNIMIGVTDYVKFQFPLQAKPYGPLTCWSKA